MHINTIIPGPTFGCYFGVHNSLLGINSSYGQVVCLNANILYYCEAEKSLVFPIHTSVLVMPSLKLIFWFLYSFMVFHVDFSARAFALCNREKYTGKSVQ